jgi:hypothetical protein
MGAFGGDETTKTVNTNQTSSKSLDPRLMSYATQNLDWLNNARNTGYTPYQGATVAPLSGDEATAGGMIRGLAGTTDPYTSTLEGVYTNAATAPASHVSTGTAVDNVGGHSTQDYMDPYIQGVLDPALRELEKSKEINLRDLGLKSALGGAFGDARTGFADAEYRNLADLAKTDTTMKGYSDAYNAAMNLKLQDLSRMLGADTTNAGLNETALQRALLGGQTLQGLDRYDTGRQLDLASALGQVGATSRGIDQAAIDRAMAEYAKTFQYPLDIAKTQVGAVSSLAPSLTTGTTSGTTETTAPDNSGWEALGSLGGALIGSIGGPVGTAAGTAIGKNLFS